MGQWRARVDALDDGPEPKEPERELHLSSILDGRGYLSGCFDADLHELVRAALDAAEQPDTEAEKANGAERSGPTRKADALGTVCRSFLDHQAAPTGASGTRHVPHVNVIVDVDDLTGDGPGAHYANGAPVSKESLKSMLCDSWVRSIFMAGHPAPRLRHPKPACAPATCGTPSSPETNTAGSRDVTAPPHGAPPTT